MSAPLRTVRRRVVRSIPPERRVKGLGAAKGRGWLQVRKLVAPLFQVPVTLQTPSGLRLRVSSDPVDEQIASHVLGPHRVDYFPAFPDGTPRNVCILDVGAHHGLYAAAALAEYPGSRIVCVEPSGQALPHLRENLALNGFDTRARIVNAALAPEAGSGQLQHTTDGTWGYSLYEDAADATGFEDVQLATLADVLDGERPDIVKCNAEGAEYCLLPQLDALGLRPRLVILMVHPHFGDMGELLARAVDIGYRVCPIGTEQRPAFQLWRSEGRPPNRSTVTA